MLYWAGVFFIIALLMAIFGFGGFVPVAAAGISRVLFLVFLVLAILSVFFGRVGEER